MLVCNYHNDDCVSSLADNLTGGYDCNNVCNGSGEVLAYWFDADSDGLGSGDPDLFCSATVEGGWVLNDDDEDPIEFHPLPPRQLT